MNIAITQSEPSMQTTKSITLDRDARAGGGERDRGDGLQLDSQE